MKPIRQWTKQDLIGFVKGVDKKTWGMVGGGIAGIALLWFFFIAPAWIERPRLSGSIREMDAQLRQYQVLNQRRLRLEEDMKVFTKLFDETKARLYKEGDIALLLGQVAKLASDSKVDMIASKPKSETVVFPKPYGDRYQTVSYDFTMQGGYHQIGKLAAALESHPKLIRIQKIQIVPDKDKTERHVVQFEIAAISERIGPVTARRREASGKVK